MLTERQQQILRLVVDAYLASGEPVGSKAIAAAEGVEWSPSTVRAELAALEAAGYLTHPHTSAGRVPTEAGYRFYADLLLAGGRRAPRPAEIPELRRMRREVDEGIGGTTGPLSGITAPSGLATAPPPSRALTPGVGVRRL